MYKQVFQKELLFSQVDFETEICMYIKKLYTKIIAVWV